MLTDEQRNVLLAIERSATVGFNVVFTPKDSKTLLGLLNELSDKYNELQQKYDEAKRNKKQRNRKR